MAGCRKHSPNAKININVCILSWAVLEHFIKGQWGGRGQGMGHNLNYFQGKIVLVHMVHFVWWAAAVGA